MSATVGGRPSVTVPRQARLRAGNVAGDILHVFKDDLGTSGQAQALLSGHHTASVTAQKRDVQFLFEGFDLTAESGLGDAQPFSRGGNTAQFDDLNEVSKLPEFHSCLICISDISIMHLRHEF